MRFFLWEYLWFLHNIPLLFLRSVLYNGVSFFSCDSKSSVCLTYCLITASKYSRNFLLRIIRMFCYICLQLFRVYFLKPLLRGLFDKSPVSSYCLTHLCTVLADTPNTFPVSSYEFPAFLYATAASLKSLLLLMLFIISYFSSIVKWGDYIFLSFIQMACVFMWLK